MSQANRPPETPPETPLQTPLPRDSFSGIYETHLPVSDLQRAIGFYRDQLGLELAREIPERGVAFFWVGGRDRSMLGLWQGAQGQLTMQLHFAFRCDRAAVLDSPARLRAAGIVPLGFHGEAVDEPVVIGWMPALSIYFKDPDGHSLELLHLLDGPGDAAFGVQPWSEWQRQQAKRSAP